MVVIKSLPVVFLMFGLSACSSGPGNPAFPLSFDDANAAIEQMRSDPKPLPRPVVIIGGFGDPNVSPPLFRRVPSQHRRRAGFDHGVGGVLPIVRRMPAESNRRRAESASVG